MDYYLLQQNPLNRNFPHFSPPAPIPLFIPVPVYRFARRRRVWRRPCPERPDGLITGGRSPAGTGHASSVPRLISMRHGRLDVWPVLRSCHSTTTNDDRFFGPQQERCIKHCAAGGRGRLAFSQRTAAAAAQWERGRPERGAPIGARDCRLLPDLKASLLCAA